MVSRVVGRAASVAAWTRLILGTEETSRGCEAAAGSLTYATSFASSAANEKTDSIGNAFSSCYKCITGGFITFFHVCLNQGLALKHLEVQGSTIPNLIIDIIQASATG
jgi:hypothetical protein